MTRRTLLLFLLRRACLLIVLAFLSASAMMLIASLAPGDTADLVLDGASPETVARERARLGLDEPLARRYAQWAWGALRLDFGTSIRYERDVLPLVIERAAHTAVLALSAFTAGLLMGLPAGIVTGSGRHPRLSTLLRGLSIVTLSVPPLLLSLFLAFLAARTGWFPVGGMTSVEYAAGSATGKLADIGWHLFLPAAALALPLAAMLERLQAAAVASGRQERHVLAARARGAAPARVVLRALWRPTFAPLVGVLGLAAGTLLSGSLAVEIVMAWPGLGRLMYEALGGRDAALAAGCAAAAALFLAAWTTLADALAWLLDPRVRREGDG
jgi:peptide/nickel transport system permease protein